MSQAVARTARDVAATRVRAAESFWSGVGALDVPSLDVSLDVPSLDDELVAYFADGQPGAGPASPEGPDREMVPDVATQATTRTTGER